MPLTKNHHIVGDRVYVADAQDGSRWLVGSRALPMTEARIQRVFSYDVTAGWVTTAGDVVFAQASPEDAPTAIGALPTAPTATGKLVLVGTWTSTTPTELGRTVKLDSQGGEGDECGGSAEYRFTLAPPDEGAGAERVGVSWWGGWSRPFCG